MGKGGRPRHLTVSTPVLTVKTYRGAVKFAAL